MSRLSAVAAILVVVCLALGAGVAIGLSFHGGASSLLGLLKNTGTINGGVYFGETAGQSEILRGIQVALCHPTIRSDLKESIDKVSSCRESTQKAEEEMQLAVLQSGGIASPLLVSLLKLRGTTASFCYSSAKLYFQTIDEIAAKSAVKCVRSNIDGKFDITEITPGDYVLCATNWTATSAVYWLLPVTTRTKPIQIDLNGSNIAASLKPASLPFGVQ